LEVHSIIESSNVKDCTRYIRTAILRRLSLGSTSDWSQKGGNNKEERELICKEETLRNNNGIQAIKQKLPSAFHSAGAQNQQQYQAQRSNENSDKESPISGDQQRSVLTARAVDRGVKLELPSRVNKRCSACQCDEVIKQRDRHQTAGRCTSWAGQYNGVRRLLLYTRLQEIRPQLSPIIEQEECPDSIAIASLKTSQQRLLPIPSLSSSEILSDCSAERRNKVALANTNFVCSTLRCMLTSGPKTEQGRIVPEMQATTGEQPSDDITSFRQDEHDEHLSCNNNVSQMTV